MTAPLVIELEGRTLDRVDVDLAIAGFFADERPLRGAAGRVDWRLCGLVSEQLVAGRIRGEAGEAVLLPTFGRLLAPRVLLLGLGERAHFGRDDVRSHTSDALRRALALGAASVGLAPLGVAADALPDLADDLVRAALDPIRDPIRAPRPPSPDAVHTSVTSFRLCILVPSTHTAPLRRALAEAVDGVADGAARLEGPPGSRRATPPPGTPEGLSAARSGPPFAGGV